MGSRVGSRVGSRGGIQGWDPGVGSRAGSRFKFQARADTGRVRPGADMTRPASSSVPHHSLDPPLQSQPPTAHSQDLQIEVLIEMKKTCHFGACRLCDLYELIRVRGRQVGDAWHFRWATVVRDAVVQW